MQVQLVAFVVCICAFQPSNARGVLQNHKRPIGEGQLFLRGELHRHRAGIARLLQLQRAVDLLGPEWKLGRHFYGHSQAHYSLALGGKIRRHRQQGDSGLELGHRIHGNHCIDSL